MPMPAIGASSARARRLAGAPGRRALASYGWVLHSDNGGPMKGATMLGAAERRNDPQALQRRARSTSAAHRRHPERSAGDTRQWERPRTVTLNPENRRSADPNLDSYRKRQVVRNASRSDHTRRTRARPV
jgi:hypothetical protein